MKLEKIDNGKWRVEGKVKDSDNKWKHINRLFNLRKEAVDFRNIIEQEGIKKAEVVSKKTLNTIAEEYLEKERIERKQRSYLFKESMLKKDILPFFDLECDIKDSITIETITRWINNLKQDERSNNRKNRIISQMKELLAKINLTGLISNLDYGIILDKMPKFAENEANKEMDIWTLDQFNYFISFFEKNDFYYVAYNFLFFTGVRRAELFGLRWEDFDEEKRLVKIHQQYDPSTKVSEDTTKTKNGVREVLLDDNLYKIMVDYKKASSGSKKSRIFNKTSTPLREKKERMCDKIGLKPIRLHDFRHSHCSLLIKAYIDSNQSINFLAIAKRLGDTVQTVMNVYSHLYPGDNQTIIGLLNNLDRTTQKKGAYN